MTEPVICEECRAEGKRSRVYDGGTVATAMSYHAYFDEEGHRHVHDPNFHTTAFACTFGHQWTATTRLPCPTCGEWWDKSE